MAYQDILYVEQDGVATITINRPEVYNAFRAQTCEELLQAVLAAGWNKQIGVIVLAGAGDKAFCTGGDQKSQPGGEGYGGRGTVGLPVEELHSAIRDVPQPVIARVQGYAIGGGNVLATVCDLTIASSSRDLRPGGAEGRLSRPGLWNRVSGADRRRKTSPRDLVSLPPLHGRRSTCHGPGQCRGAARRTRRRSRPLVRGAPRTESDGAGDRQAFAQRRHGTHSRQRRHGLSSAGVVLPDGRAPRRRGGVSRKAAA